MARNVTTISVLGTGQGPLLFDKAILLARRPREIRTKAATELAHQDMPTLLRMWSAELGYPPAPHLPGTLGVSPAGELMTYRRFANLVGPHCKRGLICGVAGTIHYSSNSAGMGVVWGHIVDAKGGEHRFAYDASVPLLVKDGQDIRRGKILQYTLLDVSQPDTGTACRLEKPLNFSTIFRWVQQNHRPRHGAVIQNLQDAVIAAKTARKSNKLGIDRCRRSG